MPEQPVVIVHRLRGRTQVEAPCERERSGSEAGARRRNPERWEGSPPAGSRPLSPLRRISAARRLHIHMQLQRRI